MLRFELFYDSYRCYSNHVEILGNDREERLNAKYRNESVTTRDNMKCLKKYVKDVYSE